MCMLAEVVDTDTMLTLYPVKIPKVGYARLHTSKFIFF